MEAEKEFTINWTLTRYTNLVNLSLYYYTDEVHPVTILIDYPDFMTQYYVWDTSELDMGGYYLQVRIDDTINTLFTVNSSHPLEIIQIISPPPLVIDTFPADGAINVDVSLEISISFNKKMEIGSFSAGVTFIIRPIIEGNISLYDSNTVKFTPREPLEYNTSYRIILKDVRNIDSLELADPYEFSFRTQDLREYEVNGKVFPKNAMVEINGNNIEVDSNGYFQRTLANGTYTLKAVLNGYYTYVSNITIDGTDMVLGEIILEHTSEDDDTEKPDDDDSGNLTEEIPEESSMNSTLIIVTIVLIVLIFGVVIAIILYVKKTRDEDDITPKTVEYTQGDETGGKSTGSEAYENPGEEGSSDILIDENIHHDETLPGELEELTQIESSSIENNDN
jgi:hypothetical protein